MFLSPNKKVSHFYWKHSTEIHIFFFQSKTQTTGANLLSAEQTERKVWRNEHR